eukprot:scaffold391_cov151-Ochromonas_danica.AAC.4
MSRILGYKDQVEENIEKACYQGHELNKSVISGENWYLHSRLDSALSFVPIAIVCNRLTHPSYKSLARKVPKGPGLPRPRRSAVQRISHQKLLVEELQGLEYHLED